MTDGRDSGTDADEVDRYDALDGQVALVTGATRGIGERIAARLVALGATTYAGARDVDDVNPDATASGSPDGGDGALRPVELDVTDDATVARAVDRVASEAGRLDVLVNNAGVGGPEAPLHEVAVADADATLDVNLRGPIVLTRAALPHLLDRPGGRVVNVSSGMGALGEGMSGRYGPYRASKAGLNGLTAYLHGEYGDEGLLANAACPGWVRTDLGSPAAPKSADEGADTPAWLATFRPGAPSGRFWRDRARIDW